MILPQHPCKLRNMGFVFAISLIHVIFVSFAILEIPANVAAIGGEEWVAMGGYGEEKLSTVLIDGSVLCDPCDHLNPTPHPISGALVAVVCGTKGKTRKACAHNMTDEYGDFLIDLPSHLHAIPNLEKVCTVKVVHLPKNSLCKPHFTRRTNIHKPIKLTSIGDGIRTYTSDNIAVMPKATKACRRRARVARQVLG